MYWLTPSRANVLPTLPARNWTPFCGVPAFKLASSDASFSPRHQLIKEADGAAHCCAAMLPETVSTKSAREESKDRPKLLRDIELKPRIRIGNQGIKAKLRLPFLTSSSRG